MALKDVRAIERTAWSVTRLPVVLLLACAALTSAGCAALIASGTVDPVESSQEAATLAAAVRDALQANQRVDSGDVSVSASGYVVTLNGTVPSKSQADEAVATSLRVSGVRRVVNRLSVTGT